MKLCIFQILVSFIIKKKCLFWHKNPVFIYFCMFFNFFWKILSWIIFYKMRQIDATFRPILAFLRHIYFKSKMKISVKMVLLEWVCITFSENALNAVSKKVRVSFKRQMKYLFIWTYLKLKHVLLCKMVNCIIKVQFALHLLYFRENIAKKSFWHSWNCF